MQIKVSTVRKVLITDVPRLDPITVILEDYEHGKGKIIVECYGQSWSSYWGAMGCNISEFVTTTDSDYLIKNLASGLESVIDDFDNFSAFLKTKISELFKSGEINEREAESQSLRSEYVEKPNDNTALMTEIFGDEWFRTEWPTKRNPDYDHLQNIVTVVQSALKQSVDTPASLPVS